MKLLIRYSWLMPLVSGGMVLICLIYCRIWWTPHPMTLGDPDESIICWMFCSTMNNFWFSLGVLFSLLSITGGVMIRSDFRQGKTLASIGGILLLPVGFINFIPLYVSKKSAFTNQRSALS